MPRTITIPTAAVSDAMAAYTVGFAKLGRADGRAPAPEPDGCCPDVMRPGSLRTAKRWRFERMPAHGGKRTFGYARSYMNCDMRRIFRRTGAAN
jgi:hypothetical protein